MLTRFSAVSIIFKRLCYGTLCVLSLFYLICLSGTLGQCVPLAKAWDVTGTVAGTCINTTAFFYCTFLLQPLHDPKTVKGGQTDMTRLSYLRV